MIKKILLGAIYMTSISMISAKSIHQTEPKDGPKTEIRQQVPKSVIIKTKKFKVRIDKQPNGNYLYQSWPAKGKIISKPSMIISDGELIPDGSGGNYYFEFHNEGYTYKVWRNYLTDSLKKAPYTLTVEDQDGKTIVNQDAIVVKS
ncbi:hypothetical protein [Chryseobacterium taichungense]|uniref:hypothetical protein n=1 Tax=Chryseobacterium taichungense TaxID=295069 RepID=UPI0028A7E30F|nr:hypothetical protein [Chryseobacterium taichungense]